MSNVPSGVFLRERRRNNRRAARNQGRVAVLVVAGLVALLVLTVGWSWTSANRGFEATGIAGLGDGPFTDAPDGTRNTLLVTSDAGGAEMIAVVQTVPGTDGPTVLFLPLQLEILPPGGVELTTVAALRNDEGPELLVAAVEDYTGIPLHHVVDIDLAGFGRLLDAVGGVRACVPTAPEQVGETIKASDECPVIDAATVASATALTDDDGVDLFRRFEIRRVLAVAVAERVRTSTFLFRPLRTRRAAAALSEAVFTNVDPGARGMVDLAESLTSEATTPADLRVVPGFTKGDSGRVEPYPDQAESLFTAFRDVSEIPAEIGLQPPTELEPSEIRVLVLNGVGTPGLAASMAAFLQSRDFTVVEPANVVEFDRAQRAVIVRHTSSTRPQAGLIVDLIPGAVLEEVADLSVGVEEGAETDVPVVVIVGSDWNS